MGEIHRLPGGRFPKTYGDERHEALLGTPTPGDNLAARGSPDTEQWSPKPGRGCRLRDSPAILHPI